MTTPKPVALPELPLKKFCVDGEAWAYTGKQMHAYALSAIAMHRAEVERLREALDEAVRRADEAERAANAEARLADQAAAAMQERCAQVCDSIDMRNTRQGAADCAAAIRSLSSTTGATNKD